MCKNKTFKCKGCLLWQLWFLNQAFTICLTYLRFLEIASRNRNAYHVCTHSMHGLYHVHQRMLVVPFCFPGYSFNDPPNRDYFYWFWSPVETVSTSSVVSDHQDSVVGPFAGAVVLNDSTKVVLPAHSIHNHSQGTVLHQVTHHGLFLTAKGGQQDRLVLMRQNWPCAQATLFSYYHVKCTIKKEGCRIYTCYRKNGWNSTIQWDSSGTPPFPSHIFSVN